MENKKREWTVSQREYKMKENGRRMEENNKMDIQNGKQRRKTENMQGKNRVIW